MLYYYNDSLSLYMTPKQIKDKIKELKKKKWNTKYFQTSYINRVMYAMLQKYKNRHKLSAGEVLGGIMDLVSRRIFIRLRNDLNT